jgi:hypothetical protein
MSSLLSVAMRTCNAAKERRRKMAGNSKIEAVNGRFEKRETGVNKAYFYRVSKAYTISNLVFYFYPVIRVYF